MSRLQPRERVRPDKPKDRLFDEAGFRQDRPIDDRNRALLWGYSLSVEYLCCRVRPVVASSLSPRAEMSFLRHVSPTQVLALKKFVSDLMTWAALTLGHSRHRSSLQSIETPEGAGNP